MSCQLFFRSSIRFFLVMFCGILSLPGCSATLTDDSFQVQGKLKIPTADSWKMSNGMRVLFIENNELPVVSGSIFFAGGSYWWTGKQGAISAMGHLIRAGGSGSLGPLELDDALEQIGANASSDFGREYGVVSFSTLSSEFDSAMQIFSSVVREPQFNQERLELWRLQTVEAIKRRKDSADAVVDAMWREFLFGDGRYGQVLTSDEVKNINQKDLWSAYNQFVAPNNAMLLIYGRTNKSEVAALVERYFADWKMSSPPLSELPPIKDNVGGKIYFYNGGYPQSAVVIAETGVPRHLPEQFAIQLHNNILGGGFGSRLFKRIRTELGLAYSVGGGISPSRVKGANHIFLNTKGENIALALTESIRTLAAISSDGVAPEEVEAIRKSIERNFVFNFRKPQDVLTNIAELELLGYPENYYETFLSKLASVTYEDVSAVGPKFWDLSRLEIFIAGDQMALDSIRGGVAAIPELKNYTLIEVGFNEKATL